MGKEIERKFLVKSRAFKSSAKGTRYRQGYLSSVKDIMPPCGRLAMENGIQSYEMNAQWARRATRELQGSPQ